MVPRPAASTSIRPRVTRSELQRIHAGSAIEWVDDALPTLVLHQHPGGGRFDAVFATAVWMHLDAEERGLAMARIAALLMADGRFFVNLRHGPVPDGRHMFDVSAAETVELGAAHVLRTLLSSERSDLHGRDDVRWSSLVLQAKDSRNTLD